MLAFSNDRHGIEHTRLRALLNEAAAEAGRIAAAYFRAGERTTAQVWSKEGGSPVTEADLAVDAFLKERLTGALPQAGWLSEETQDDPARLAADLVWIVDPIDGTRAFLAGDPQWAVSIALVEAGVPVAGTVHAPALGHVYEALLGAGATLNGGSIRASGLTQARGARVAGPKPLVEALERRSGPVVHMPRVPSLALRLARVAAGDLDAGLVATDARDWDIAAADLILAEAGGRLTTLAGERPLYNRSDPVHGMLVSAGAGLHGEILQALADTGEAKAQGGD